LALDGPYHKVLIAGGDVIQRPVRRKAAKRNVRFAAEGGGR